MNGYPSDLHGYIIILCLRHVSFDDLDLIFKVIVFYLGYL